MAWTVKILPSAQKELKRLDRQISVRILNYLTQRIEAGEDPRRFGKALTSNLDGLWRYRIGDYRVICEIKDEVLTVLVVRVGHRSAVYKI
jgi:mRNA interferase RelE/StbE